MKAQFPSNLSSRGLILLKKFSKLKLMVAGDLVVDESIYGDTERISREAPVLILRYTHTQSTPGGAANAANNAVDLGAQVYPLGVLGADEPGGKLLQYFKTKKVNVSGILTLPKRPTVVKCRIMAGAHHTAKQQVIRIDKIEDKEISRAAETELIFRARTLAPRMDALLISDYHLGVMTEALRRALLSIFEGKIITVDSRFNLGEYRGVSLMTPNLSEAGPAVGLEITNEASLVKVGQSLRQKSEGHVIITRGPQGMSLFDRKGKVTHLPVHGLDQPVDPTGAGDTVAATATLALAAGADLTLAAALASVAAGLVVAKRGTATTSLDEIQRALKSDSLKP
ncbi:MAG: bifunctional heptose 7-phosphate kinase/heptose 1-phosphate adenyltransferase [bacterium]